LSEPITTRPEQLDVTFSSQIIADRAHRRHGIAAALQHRRLDRRGDQVHWTDPLNWSGQALPGASDDVVIGASANVQLDSDATVSIRSVDLSGSLTISHASLGISTWYVDSTVNASGKLTLDMGGVFSGTWQTNLIVHGTMHWAPGVPSGPPVP
jgi:hypothetical protein